MTGKKKDAEQDRDLKKFRSEFLQKGVYKALYGMLERKVRAASMCTDHLLNQKRDKLRKLLLAEEEAYAKEYVALCQAANEAKQEAVRRKAIEIKAKRERESRELVERKLMEMKIQDCETARTIRSQKALKMVKKDQLWQIKEKYVLKEAQREEERMYHDMMMKNLLALKERDEEHAKLQLIKRLEAKETFIEQLKYKEIKSEKERRLKEFEKRQMEEEVRKSRMEEEKEAEERRRKNAQRIAEYQEYLMREREIKERRRREEEEIDRAYTKLMQIEGEKEKLKVESNKERFKREMENYLESYKEIQKMRILEDQRTNELVEELSAKIREQQDQHRRSVILAKRELHNMVLRERAEQVKEKKEREKREEEVRNQEIELLNLQIEQQRKIREEYEKRCEVKRLEYRRQLIEQIKEAEEAKARKKCEEEEYARLMRLEEERRIEETKAILDQCCSLPVHPMQQIIMNNPPKFECLPYPR
ncbi:UNVERIFIED_CONTAM: hypothetical protein PYX00_001172 [Menopon gallinae]|uniref:Meiosis-specific nuclear structural protein 1 n=1 Tax=Menopon gallinae TaxID=328185 RepID=A0AAW2ID51_9NEOP